MEKTLAAIAQHLNGRLIGDGAILIQKVNSIDAVKAGELTFAEDARHLAKAMQSAAAAVIVSATITELPNYSGISVSNPRLAFAQALELFHPAPPPQERRHPTAVIGQDVQCGAHVDVRAHVVIGDRVRIGRGTILEPGTIIGDDVVIGEDSLIGPNAVLYRRTQIGHRVRIHGGSVIGGDGFGYVFDRGRHVKIPQVGYVIIEDDVEIGCNACVDKGTIEATIVRQGTKIDNFVQIAHNNQIGRHVILAGQVGLAGSVTIGDYSVLGGKAGVIDHIVVGKQVRAGASSIITKSFPDGSNLWGYPARHHADALRQMAALARLPGLLKQVKKFLARKDESM